MKIRRFALAMIAAGLIVPRVSADDFAATTAPVGRDGNSLMTPVNQIVTPVGVQIGLSDTRPNALALSPDGRLLVTAGLTNGLVVVDPARGTISQQVPFPSGALNPQAALARENLLADTNAQPSMTGLIFSPDGSRIYLSNANGDLKVFAVGADKKVTPLGSVPLPPAHAPLRVAEIPSGLAIAPDGRTIYVAGNLSNRVLALDTTTGKLLRSWDVGVAPFDLALTGNKLYVSNWGGRRPDANSVTGPAGQGTTVRVDNRSIANEGSVTVIDLTRDPASAVIHELVLGPHVCALALSPSGRWLVAASAGSDLLSVIDTRNDEVVETVSARQTPGDPLGAQPDALVFDGAGKTLYCANASQNAIAVFQFKPRETTLLGLVPVGWFPGALAFDKRENKIYAANIKSIGDTMQTPRAGLGKGRGFNTRQFIGSLSLVPVPTKSELAADTQKALANLRYPLLAEANLPPRSERTAVPVPERAGEPSVFRHVIYIIKENRTYDQVLGDVSTGNGNADLCVFGDRVTPNEHKLVRDFVLLDNTYCCGILSADGHNWADSALATEYIEREFGAWSRSYPSGGDTNSQDALAYSPAGFIWDNALAHHKTVRDYGEYSSPVWHWNDSVRRGQPRFADYYADYMKGGGDITVGCTPDLESLRSWLDTNTVGWNLDVPDVFRAGQFIQELNHFEQGGNLPNLAIIWLPNDHTSGVKTNCPTPRAQVADNDLAMGRIVEAVSHSVFWRDTCIFAVEDDPQNGWDHVSGYRTTAYVVSPYTRRGAAVHTQYNQTSLLRTMELMLGLPPMTQFDATATPMFDCFTNLPDFTAFDAVTNTVPLDEMNPVPAKAGSAQVRQDAYVSARLPLEKPDQCDEDVLNRILWRSVKGAKAYPVWAAKVTGDD